MKQSRPNKFITLAIALTTRGFGFAVIEEPICLVDWGCKSVAGNKNAQSIAKVEKLIARYKPGFMVLQDALAKNSIRSDRIKLLTEEIKSAGKKHGITVKLIPKEMILRSSIDKSSATKHGLAVLIATRFPELSSQLPPKRKPWTSEDSRMDIFDAVALGLAAR